MVTLHRAFELQQYSAGHARGPGPPTPSLSQSTQDTGSTPSPDPSVLDATMQAVSTFSSSMTSFLSKSRGSIKHSRSEVLKDATSLVSGSRYGVFTGEDTFPAEAWIADVQTFLTDETFLAEFKEHERPRNLWEVLLRCVGTAKPSGRNFSPKSYLEYQRAELIKSGTPAAQYPTFDMVAQWLLDEFPSDNAKATLLAEFLNERPTRMEPQHLIAKLQRRIQPIRDLEAVSVQQCPFEQMSSHLVHKSMMECLDHLERMYADVIVPQYKAKLKGSDIHQVPKKMGIKDVFIRMATMREAARLQAAFDTSNPPSQTTTTMCSPTRKVTTDKVDLRLVSFENMCETLLHVFSAPDCGPNHLAGGRIS
jgi:hypothetical protein